MTNAIAATQQPMMPAQPTPPPPPVWQEGRDLWAAAPTEQLGKQMLVRVERFYDVIKTCGRLDMWRRMTAAYYGEDPDGGGAAHSDSFAGDQGEVVLARSNECGALIEHLHVIITGARPAAQVIACAT